MQVEAASICNHDVIRVLQIAVAGYPCDSTRLLLIRSGRNRGCCNGSSTLSRAVAGFMVCAGFQATCSKRAKRCVKHRVALRCGLS